MDNLFKTRTLTSAINAMKKPGDRIFQRHFQPVLNWQPGSRLAWDIISGSEGVLRAIRIDAPADVGNKTNRKTITMESPRLAEKRLINNSEVQDIRRYGELAPELMRARIAREQMDLRNMFDRTLEFWGGHALRGILYDKDLTTELVNYNFSAGHLITLAAGAKWDSGTQTIIADLRQWKRTIEDDSSHSITNWHAWTGWKAMDCILADEKVKDLLKYDMGSQIAKDGRIASLAGVNFEEYNASFKLDDGTRKRFIEPNQLILIGEGSDVFDCPYLSAVSDEEMLRQLFFSNSWVEKDPAGRWIFGESRVCPVVKRPDAIIVVTVCDAPV